MESETKVSIRNLVQEHYANIAGLIVLKDDQIVYEDYFDGFDQLSSIHVASVTKSIISALIGIAIDRKAVDNIEQKVLDFFPDYKIKRGEKTIQKITIKNLLTMTAPYKYKYEPYTKVYSSNDWTSSALDLLGGKSRIGDFKYTTVGIQILSGIIAKASGQSVSDFAQENLFRPLDIPPPSDKRINSREEYTAFLKDKHVSGWVVDPGGANTAGWGLALSTGDMVKIGQLYINKGNWNNRKIISSKWIEESTGKHSQWGDLSYGYLWWVLDGEKDNSFAAIGDGGNLIYVSPELNTVVAISSRFMPRAKDRIELVRKHILPIVNPERL